MMDTAFSGNHSLPAADATYDFTAEEIREFVKCKNDPVYFIRTYMRIINVDKGLVPFDLYPFQEHMVRSYQENRFNITMCSRQVGKSVTIIGWILHYIMFTVNVKVCISANKQKTAADLLGRLKLAYEHLPRFLQQGVSQWARLEITLANGSSVFAAATSSSAVRGGSYNCLILEEFAFVPDNIADEFYASTFPTISSGSTTKIIMVSTPNGMNLFHKFWVDAKSGNNDFVPIFAHWSEVPGRDEVWKQNTIRNIGGVEKFAQEYECSFLSTGYTLIRPAVLQTLAHKNPVVATEEGYHEYEPPRDDRTYVQVVDAGQGLGEDYSTFVVLDVTELPYRVVATYANNRISTMEFPQVIMETATRYHYPWMMVEVMDVGRDVAHIISRDFEYPKLMTTMTEKRLGQRLVFNSRIQRHLGLRMTAGVKRSGCSILKTLIEKGQLELSDYRIIRELSTFVQIGSTFGHQPGHHDDLIMPLVMFGWISLQPNFAEIVSVRALDTHTKLVKATKENAVPVNVPTQDPVPIGYFSSDDPDDDASWLLQ